MTNLIRFDGADSEYLYFSTASMSMTGIRYTITIRKSDGYMECDCMGASCHKYKGKLGDNVCRCKHQISLIKFAGSIAPAFKEYIEAKHDSK